MNSWKERLKAEYAELKERLENIHRWNVKQEADDRLRLYSQESISDAQNKALCREQEETMACYLHIIEIRAAINGIKLE